MSGWALSLIAPHGSDGIIRPVLSAIGELLPETTQENWLSDGEALDILLPEGSLQSNPNLLQNVRTRLQNHTIDVNLIPRDGRRKKLLIADMESTIIAQECLDELADFVGLRDRVEDITARAMRGEIAFEVALKDRVALLRDLPEGVLETVYRDRVTLMPGAEELVATMREHDAYCALVSGGFTYFSSRIAEQLSFHSHQANALIIEEGRLTGKVCEPILGRDAKRAALDRLCSDIGIDPSGAVAVGDGANDLAMLDAAGLGVAFRAKPLVADKARVKIIHGDLRALLYLQGYTSREITRGLSPVTYLSFSS